MKKMGILLFPISTILLITVQGQVTKGFFLNDSQEKNADIPPSEIYNKDIGNSTIVVNIDASKVLTSVSPYIYGVNSSIYMGDISDNDSDLDYIKALAPHVIRYPGGDISNLFFWNKGDKDVLQDLPDTLSYLSSTAQNKASKQTYWKGFTTNPSRLSVDDYYKVLSKTNCTGLISVNYSYARYGLSQNPVQAAAHYAADWVRYDKGRTKFWEIGNENYGAWETGYMIDTRLNKDHQPAIITGSLYGQQASVFIDSMKYAAKEIGTNIYIGIHLTEHSVTTNIPYKTWNEEVLKAVGDKADFFIVHSYFTRKNENTSSDEILNSPDKVLPKIMEYVRTGCKKVGVRMKPLALTEWNISAVHSKQATSTINGMHAVLVLGESIKNNFALASRWALVQASKEHGDDKGIFEKDGNNLWHPYPVFFYMHYFQQFMGNKMILASVSPENRDIAIYSSTFSSGELGVIIINKGNSSENITLNPQGYKIGKNYYWYSLVGDQDSEFPQGLNINGVPVNGNNYKSIKAYSHTTNMIEVPAPKKSVEFILIEKDN